LSALASFNKIQYAALDGLKQAAVPKKRFFGAPKDVFFDFLQTNSSEVASYRWSGFVIATLLPYLEEKHQINLMKSDYDEMANYLSDTRAASFFILTETHKQRYLPQLVSDRFSENALRDYFNKFNRSNDTEVGVAMLDGIRAFHESLRQVDRESVIILSIG
jgi:hypothetical protein